MLIAIKKCEFFTRKTNFIGFIIKLGYISMDLKKSGSYSKLVRTRKHYVIKIISRVLQLLLKVYSIIVKEY